MTVLKSREGYTIGSSGCKYTALDYLQSTQPKKGVFPKGFRDMIREEYPQAWSVLCNGGAVHGHRFRDILEANFEQHQYMQENNITI